MAKRKRKTPSRAADMQLRIGYIDPADGLRKADVLLTGRKGQELMVTCRVRPMGDIQDFIVFPEDLPFAPVSAQVQTTQEVTA